MLILIIILLLIFGAGGWGWRSGYYGGTQFGGGVGLILLLFVLYILFAGGRL